MYKVLIVDDEPWVAYGIKALVEWEELGFNVIGEAYNGIEALETIIDMKPDVVITDIRMPGLNGIELMEQIKNRQIHTKVILVSGYAEFEYAQKALHLGAFGYLLKQIEKDDLVNALKRLRRVLDEKHQTSLRRDLFMDTLFEILKPDNKMAIMEFIAKKGLNFELPNYRFISFTYPKTMVAPVEEKCKIDDKIKCICLRTGQNEISVLINYNELNSPNVVELVLNTIFKEAELVGVSSRGFSETPITRLFQESNIALYSALFLSCKRVIEYKITDMGMMLPKLLLSIESLIREQKQEQIYQFLDELCNTCKEKQLLIDQISLIYNQIVALCKKYYPDHNSIGEIEYLNYYLIISYYHSIDELFEMIKSFFEKRNGKDIQVSNELVKRILKFIDNSYKEDILLGDLSKKFNVSLGYLSSLIKKETGKTYTEYITNKRMELAKELLKDEHLSIEEIVQRIGYTDYFYFNKLFKKHVGITPSKYRKISS